MAPTPSGTGSILPRIARFLPAGSMLEIAPGHGRWTAYLREHCDTLAIVDLDAGLHRRLPASASPATSGISVPRERRPVARR